MTRSLIAAAVCFLVAACAAPQTGTNSAPQAANTVPSTPSNPDQSEIEPVEPPQQAAIDPDSLVGMTGDRVSGLFGTPVFVRRDPPGEFWRYRGKTCVLELFFYQRGDALRVDHIETRQTGGGTPDRADCVTKLRKPPARS